MTAPTSLRGYVDDQMFWTSVLVDLGEMVPDLAWPESVRTYAQMRRDPKLAAILKAYTLLIRHATWNVNADGCDPKVAQMVADDLGLPLAGHDRPQAIRVRGVSWRRHLATVLLELVYGHMPFEMLADTSSGQARLVALSERMPGSIAQIRVNRDGSLKGIDQDAIPGEGKAPQINADRLVWYAHEREGSAWQGTSLLRPAFAAWLLKREMQRVLGTSNQRFGMGVPTVEWDKAATPTPGQITAARDAASAARVGHTAGLSLPPGAQLVLKGLVGSAPDTLAFLKWLDQQMSTMALAGVLDLGQTDTGSRALGDSFLNIFFLSIQSIADDIADTATRDIAARLVGWNYGPDEPVPQVTVGDIGSKREVTAESLKELLNSGALTADPGLEAYIRRAWRLPELGVKAPAAARADPPAARRRRPPPVAIGQMKLPVVATAGLRRELTETEVASGADFEGIRQDRDDALEDLAKRWPELAAALVAFLAGAAGAAVAAGTLSDLGSLEAPDSVLAPIAEAIGASMTALAEVAAARVIDEAASQGLEVPAGTADADQLSETALAIAAVIASGYANGAARQALLLASPDADEQAVADAVHEHLVALGAAAAGAGLVASNLITALAVAQAAGRMATILLAGDQVTLSASEVLDRTTCVPCSEIDGTVFADFGAALEAYPTGRYRACLGAERCRGLVIITAR